MTKKDPRKPLLHIQLLEMLQQAVEMATDEEIDDDALHIANAQIAICLAALTRGFLPQKARTSAGDQIKGLVTLLSDAGADITSLAGGTPDELHDAIMSDIEKPPLHEVLLTLATNYFTGPEEVMDEAAKDEIDVRIYACTQALVTGFIPEDARSTVADQLEKLVGKLDELLGEKEDEGQVAAWLSSVRTGKPLDDEENAVLMYS